MSTATAARTAALDTILAQCREGFEAETAEDVAAIARAARVDLTVDVKARCGYVTGTVAGSAVPGLPAWTRAHAAAAPVFARNVCFGIAVALAAGARSGRAGRLDRVPPLAHAARMLGAGAGTPLFVEHPDTNEGKALSPLARALEPRLVEALARDAGQHAVRLHAFLCSGEHAIVGIADVALDPPWPMGIPRLRVGHAAPSRSARKLVEALVTFLRDDEKAAVRPGMRAVDLGAAPGGWSWVLAQRGLRVTAVDNGPLKGEAAHDPLIAHVRMDGLRYRPRKPVDWVTCDIVETPSRIAALMSAWIGEGHARRAIFNLKLPMKRRYAEVERCRQSIVERLSHDGVEAVLGIRQLYHDREEVTAYLARADGRGRRAYSPSQ